MDHGNTTLVRTLEAAVWGTAGVSSSVEPIDRVDARMGPVERACGAEMKRSDQRSIFAALVEETAVPRG